MLSIILFNILEIFCQSYPIEGKVIDQKGSSITYASVTSKQERSLTDLEGNFNLEFPGDTIIISALGYETVTIPVQRFSGVIVLSTILPKNVTIRKK